MSKEREKQFQDKLKKFFKHNKDGSAYSQYLGQPFLYTPELQASLRADAPAASRVRTLQAVVEEARPQRLDDMQLVTMLSDVRDLLLASVPRETRQAVLSALVTLVTSQLEHMAASREQVLELVSGHDVPEDLLLRVRLLSALTEGGRQLTYMEEVVPPLLLQLLPEALLLPSADGGQAEFLRLLSNCVKFNAAYVEHHHVQAAVCLIYSRAAVDLSSLDITACLSLFDVILCYRDVPRGALVQLTALMARLVCKPQHSKDAWRLMRNLLGTSMGHVTLQVVNELLSNPANACDPALLKGCCFFGAMALWGGSQRVVSLLVRPGSLLPAFGVALDSNHPSVWHEVALELRALVCGPRGADLLPHSWDLALDLTDRLYQRAASDAADIAGWEPSLLQQIRAQVVALLTAAERLQDDCSMSGDEERLRQTLERCAADRPETSVVASVHRQVDFLLTYRCCWLPELRALVQRYFTEERRSAVRLSVCEVLSRVWEGFRSVDGSALLETVLLPAAASVAAETDPAVQERMVRLLVRLACTCRTLQCLDVVALLERVLAAPLEAGQTVTEPEKAAALEAAACGLTEVLRSHLCSLPTAIAVRAYRAIIDHLTRHYAAPELLFAARQVREPLLFCLLSLRADSQFRIGLPDPETAALRFSPHLVVEQRHHSGETPQRQGELNPRHAESAAPAAAAAATGSEATSLLEGAAVTRLSLTTCCQTVISALRQERSLPLLSALLQRVPRLLENSALVMSDRGTADVDYFAAAMCQLAADITPVLCSRLTETPATFKTSDLQSLLYPILVSLTSYHSSMTMQMHRRLIVSLESGLRSRCAPQCMTALTVCALGMREAMAKQIPDVLKGMARLSSTVTMGNSVLEFLSTLIRIPRVFARFSEEQYLSIFAIVLPYTNPAKFNHYIVSLAHHVIAMWFLKCKVRYRRCFVKYIIKGLKTNFSHIQAIWKQQQAQASDGTGVTNEDSSNRRRSSSLSDRASQPRERRGTFSVSRRSQETPADPAAARRGSLLPGPPPTHLTAHMPVPPTIHVTQELIKFHSELTETCVDLMARYTGPNYAVVPERTPLMELLLSKGVSSTWAVGNKLVTVTVGGCGGAMNRGSLCERCYNFCCSSGEAGSLEPAQPAASSPTVGAGGDSEPAPVTSPPPAVTSPLESEVRRRHTSVPVGRGVPAADAPLMRDDSQLRARGSSGDTANAQRAAPRAAAEQGWQGGPPPLCECYCQGWAEIVVRRPSGNMAWMLRLENRQLISSEELPVPDLLAVVRPGTTDQNMERLLKQAEPGAEAASAPGSAPTSPPASAGPPPEICIIQEDGDAGEPAPGGRRQLARTRSGETRRQSLFKSTSGGQIPQGAAAPASPRQGRDRSHTISVMSPARQSPVPDPLAEEERHGLLPEQVFLQLYHSPLVETPSDPSLPEPEPGESDVLLLEPGPDTERTLTLFDRITPMETHKIGVLYVAEGQATDECAILRNQCGSARYIEFLHGMGRLVELTEAQPDKTFLAGLNRDGSDGRFAIMWEDDLMQVLFHVATMMPTVDERCNNKKMHIGNDFVLIVYNESGAEFNITAIRTQFCYAGVVIEPLDHGTNRITIKTKGKLQELFGHTEVTLVSDQNLATMVRQLALHANLASLILQRGVAGPDPYASNWLERLRMIKRLRRRVGEARRKKLAERRRAGEELAPHTVDFTQLLE